MPTGCVPTCSDDLAGNDPAPGTREVVVLFVAFLCDCRPIRCHSCIWRAHIRPCFAQQIYHRRKQPALIPSKKNSTRRLRKRDGVYRVLKPNGRVVACRKFTRQLWGEIGGRALPKNARPDRRRLIHWRGACAVANLIRQMRRAFRRGQIFGFNVRSRTNINVVAP